LNLGNMGSALLDITTTASGARQCSAGALRQEAAQRLAAHRSRRGGIERESATAPQNARQRDTRSARIAAAVAERYAQAPSYRAFLEAEAERAVQEARAAAEIAALNAKALAAAQQSLLAALDSSEAAEESAIGVRLSLPVELPAAAAMTLWPELDEQAQPADRVSKVARTRPSRRFQPPDESGTRSAGTEAARARAARNLAHTVTATEAAPTGAASPAVQNTARETLWQISAGIAGGLTVRLYQDGTGATRIALDPRPIAASVMSAALSSTAKELRSDDEARALDEEIAFRHAPVFEEPAGPPMPLPANLIEFPRQLVASRKVRPRLAEGPLREGEEEQPGAAQLRIFEVDPSQIATVPEAEEAAAAAMAQWTSIWLDSRPQTAAGGSPAAHQEAALDTERGCAAKSLPDVAPVARRVLAAAVNAGVMAVALAVFAAVFFLVAGHLASGSGTDPGAQVGFAGVAQPYAARAAVLAALPYAACVFLLLGVLYQMLFFTFSAATPGMRVARIALCTFDDENPTRTAARHRLIAVLVSAVPLGLGFLWAALDEERLAWHDRICRIYQRSY
jgi:uncharacterized RDD family membrane protein YckC